MRFPTALAIVAFLLSATAPAAFTLPSRAKRVHDLEQAGLQAELKGMDELDQDLLYYHLKTKTPQELQKLYPELSLQKLETFQALGREAK